MSGGNPMQECGRGGDACLGTDCARGTSIAVTSRWDKGGEARGKWTGWTVVTFDMVMSAFGSVVEP